MIENFDFGSASALSPRTDIDLTAGLMTGFRVGQAGQMAKAKSLAEKMKQNKILSINQANIHPAFKKQAEDLVYQNLAMQKIYSDSGENPLMIQSRGKQELMDLESKSKKLFDLEKSNPDQYLLDRDAMSRFSAGDLDGAKKALGTKYDPQLADQLDITKTSYLPRRIDVKSDIEKAYGYDISPDMYKIESVKTNPGMKGRIVIAGLNDQAKSVVAKQYASNPEVQANILFNDGQDFKAELAKAKLSTKDEALARGMAFENVVRNKYLPSKAIHEGEGQKVIINNGGDRSAEESTGYYQPTTFRLNYKGPGGFDVKVDTETPAFPLSLESTGGSLGDVVSTDGKDKRKAEVDEFKSGMLTVMPINKSGKNIDVMIKGKKAYSIAPGGIVPEKDIENLVESGADIKYAPVAYYTRDRSIDGKNVKESYYSDVAEGSLALFSQAQVKDGTARGVLQDMGRLAGDKNSKIGTKKAPAKNQTKPSAKTKYVGVPEGGF